MMDLDIWDFLLIGIVIILAVYGVPPALMNSMFSTLGSADGFIKMGSSSAITGPTECQTISAYDMGFGGSEIANACTTAFFKYDWNCDYTTTACPSSINPTGSDQSMFYSSLFNGGDQITRASSFKISPNMNLAGLNFRVDITHSPVSKTYVVDEYGGKLTDGSSGAGLLELRPSVTESSLSDVFWLGVYQTTVDGSDGLYISTEGKSIWGCGRYCGMSANVRYNDMRYKPLFDCTLGPNDMIAYEPFSGPKTIDINDLRFPVKKFCFAHPATVVTAGGSTTTAEPYLILSEGMSFSIPELQTWGFFYIFDNSQGLVPTTCTAGQAFNVVDDTCRDISGIVTVCSEGVFDVDSGTCTVNPAVEAICDEGVLNDEGTACIVSMPSEGVCPSGTTEVDGKCEKALDVIEICGGDARMEIIDGEATCVYNPPVQEVCAQGTYDSETGSCIMELVIDKTCPSGFEYNEEKMRCEAGVDVSGKDYGVAETIDIPEPLVHPKTGKLSLWILLAISAVVVAIILFRRTPTGRRLFKKWFK